MLLSVAGERLCADPAVAIDVGVAENSAEQIDADLAAVRMRDNDVGFANRGHQLMFSAHEGTILAETFQLANKFRSRARSEARHGASLAVGTWSRSREDYAIEFGQLQMRDVGVDEQPVFERR